MSESELRHWLSIEDWYMSSHLREWMERVPRSQATDVLARIAQDADLEPNTPWAAVAMGLIVTGFTPSSAIAGNKLNDRRAGIRAALHLADLNDFRAVEPLARLWVPGGWRQNKYHEQIEASLRRLLDLAIEKNDHTAQDTVIAGLVRQIWNSRPLNADLSPGRTALLLAAIRYIGRQAQAESRAILEAVAAGSTRKPNRRQVQEAVSALRQTTILA